MQALKTQQITFSSLWMERLIQHRHQILSWKLKDGPTDGINQDFFFIGTSSVGFGLSSDTGLPFSNTALPTSLNLADFDYYRDINFTDVNQGERISTAISLSCN